MNESIIEDPKTESAGRYDDVELMTEPRGWIDQKLAWFSEFISPILVKETRQALKSRQFFWTFFLLLTATAVWSLLGYSIAQSQSGLPGQFMLGGYWSILGVPLGIIIPFTVFRSLASEYENDTIQLVTITTMRPHQIVVGKLGSAVLQMLVFFSVLAPCISFTYLLRGVDLMHIAFGLGISFFGSLGLSAIGLFLAGITTSNVFRIALSVGFIFGLFMAYIGFTGIMSEIASGYGPAPDQLSSILLGTSAAFFACGFLAFSASCSQISFPADNRSTLNRIAMIVFSVVAISLLGLALTSFINKFLIWSFHVIICHIWLIFGAMMCGENPFMSPRVRRSLPTSPLGKSFLSFLMPGPGRGYLFALLNLLGWTFVFIAFALFGQSLFSLVSIQSSVFSSLQKESAVAGVFANLTFATLFLSLTFLTTHFLQKKRTFLNPGGALIIGVLIFGFCLIFSMILHYSFVRPQQVSQYSDWMILNWYWTSYVWVDVGASAVSIIGAIFVCAAALTTTLSSVVIASGELVRQRVATPKRVIQDDDEQKASYVRPAESIDTIFDERKSQRESQDSTIDQTP